MIQTQQDTFVLFTLFKLTLDERKTLTKISMCKPLTTIPQTSACFGQIKQAKLQRNRKTLHAQVTEQKPVKSILHLPPLPPTHSRQGDHHPLGRLG